MIAACFKGGISEAHQSEKSVSGWYIYISPCLLLFAACIHGISEGLTLGIQVGTLPEFGECRDQYSACTSWDNLCDRMACPTALCRRLLLRQLMEVSSIG